MINTTSNHRPRTDRRRSRSGLRSSAKTASSIGAVLIGLGAAAHLPPARAQPSAGTGPLPAAFSTKLGTFTPQQWSTLTGWTQESHAEALSVFQQTCRNLKRRETWRATCIKAQAVKADTEEARAFFESEFVAYKVAAAEKGKDGLMTGYFEPILEGSAVRRAPFVVPVYGAPSDLLYLDIRRWQGFAQDGSVAATVADDQVLPLPAGGRASVESRSDASKSDASRPDGSPSDPSRPEASSSNAAAGNSGLLVDPAVFEAQPLDRRLRVRRDGNRIVPYWTRQQIESGAGIQARVIAWVDDPQALYVMQVQGSGQIRLPDGKTLRLSYADQNGHPFRPRGSAAPAVRTRGLPSEDAGSEPGPVAVATPVSMRTLSMVTVTPATSRRTGSKQSRQSRQSGQSGQSGGDAVDRVVEALLAQPPSKAGSSRPATSNAPASDPAPDAAEGDGRARAQLSAIAAAREHDPSYVFFQPASPGGGGPVGALGVPLTATRSIAVDPRSTPLGAPVFIEAERDDARGPLRRLMIAQDTGGAIRGAVRADFFWGTGPRAGAQALRTKDDLAMWVLLPKDFAGGRATGSRTRGVGATGAAAAAECVLPDAEYCLE